MRDEDIDYRIVRRLGSGGTGVLNNLESRFLHRDGHAIDMLISGRLVDMQGEAMVVSAIRDISARNKGENDLMMSR